MLRGKSTVPVSWWRDRTLLCDACDSVAVTVDTTTAFTAVATYADRTSDSATVIVTVFTTPPITMQDPPPICPGDSAAIIAPTGYRHYQWSTGDTTSTIVVGIPGVYSVTVLDTNGCVSTASATVQYQSLNVVTVDSLATGATSVIDIAAASVYERSCIEVVVRSIADSNVIIHRATMQRGVEISVPLSQFPLTISPRSTVNVRVCAMSELPGDFADTVHLQSGCGVYDVPVATRTWETPAYTRCAVRITSTGEREILLPPQMIIETLDLSHVGAVRGYVMWTLVSLQGTVVERGEVNMSADPLLHLGSIPRGTYGLALQWEGGRAAGLLLRP